MTSVQLQRMSIPMPERTSLQELDTQQYFSLIRTSLRSVANSSTNAQSQQTNKLYKCGVCNKSFHSFRALGGHKSIHGNNKRTRAEPTNITEKSQKRPRCLELFPTSAAASSDTENASYFLEEAAHKCDICRKNFPTYQALVGHKSCHVRSRENPRSLQLFPESPQLSTSTVYETVSVSSRLDNIDLELRL